MDKNHQLPFKVGQLAESKCFLAGFRGAWFRCKIKQIGMKKGHISHALEFFDFPDEKIKWTKLYEKPPPGRVSREERKMQLMVRPSFPPIYHESQMPDVCTVSEVIAIVDDIWKVGDLVDWSTDSCYWSGRITHLLGKDMVQIELPEPPVGEGRSYEAFCKDLRPTLDWSPEHGWTVPASTESETCRYCARLIQPVNQDKGRKDDHAAGGASCEFSAASISSRGSAGSLRPAEISSYSLAKEMLKQPSDSEVNIEETQTLHTNTDLDLGDGDIGKNSFSESVSSSHDKDVSAAMERAAVRRDRYNSSGSSKKMKISGNECLNSTCSDTIESSILDLEELANRIKWLKGVLQFGFRLSNAMKPSWNFLESRASFTHK